MLPAAGRLPEQLLAGVVPPSAEEQAAVTALPSGERVLAEQGARPADASAALVADLMRMTDKVGKQFPGVHVAITGGHRMSVDNSTLIKADAQRCIFLGMGAMLVLCLSAYRRKWLAVVTFLPSLFGTLMAAAILIFPYRAS